ncbi:hypothetical protein ZIOFF_032959 [Zingiber officinale]|uniref:Uncharacterized protein n=1 Tax=Zingiber officinale TaxID=94328 RepID=A0A8J5GXS6_ZINOF|nr:hypothetical protein ZIOFF_032959 [Zingiber officinale]
MQAKVASLLARHVASLQASHNMWQACKPQHVASLQATWQACKPQCGLLAANSKPRCGLLASCSQQQATLWLAGKHASDNVACCACKPSKTKVYIRPEKGNEEKHRNEKSFKIVIVFVSSSDRHDNQCSVVLVILPFYPGKQTPT